MTAPIKKRVLVVNCYFDDSHRAVRRPRKIPHAMGPAYLAGAFAAHLCEIRLYDEVSSGPLQDRHLLAWPDMLVLTGLTNAFDRMLHLTAYVRTRNPKAIVVAGGPAIRALPRLSRRALDYACLGDIEQLQEVITEAFAPAFAAEEMLPRYDLAYWMGRMGHVETSRYCNFRCSFCALTAEGRRYRSYSLEAIGRQILALPTKGRVLFIDNNFYGNDRNDFLRRVALIKELRQGGHLTDWGALVTNDFFAMDENLDVVRGAGCRVLFSGVESFDTEWLREANKKQNTTLPQVRLIARCLEAGIAFCYGLILDVASRSIADLRRELDFITGTPAIPLPSFLTVSIPILGTPFFRECLAKGLFLAETKLRDMDGTTLVLRPRDPIDEVVRFLRDVQSLRGHRSRVIRHSIALARRYHATLSGLQMMTVLSGGALLCASGLATGGGVDFLRSRRRRRTYVTTTEPLDRVYTPAFRVAAQWERYFKPTLITDESGNVADAIADSGLLDGNASAAGPEISASNERRDVSAGRGGSPAGRPGQVPQVLRLRVTDGDARVGSPR